MKSIAHDERQAPVSGRSDTAAAESNVTLSNLTMPTQLNRYGITIVSGGQSGVDRAALDFALQLGIDCGGWCPKGRWAEDGTLSPQYPLKEAESAEPAMRTELNVKDSDGTLVLNYGNPTDGTPLTVECAERHAKPCLILNLQEEINREAFWGWMKEHNIKVLNIAGPRESLAPGRIYTLATEALRNLFGESRATPSK